MKWQYRMRTLEPMVREAAPKVSKCATCNKFPWSCKCGRTALDLATWLSQVADDVRRYVDERMEP